MKKNRTMRVAVIMLSLTLITSSFVGGTFAKYTTGADAEGTARVAKWGVTATVEGGAFATDYALQDTDTTLTGYAVSATGTDNRNNVVAPGTSGTFTGVALNGTPEVAVKITKTATVTLDGWMIDDDTNPDTAAVFYCPIIFTINETPINGATYNSAAELVAAIEGAIETANGEYGPNTNLATIDGMNGDYTWSWAFEGDNANDTLLGNLETAPTITIDVDVTVEQID